HPSLCEAYPEAAIGTVPLPPREDAREGAPTTALRVHGVLWAGFRDLVALPTREERKRLRLPPAPHDWVLFDYKTSANVARYALSADALRADVQANLYAIDVIEWLAREHGLRVDRLPARWVYLESKRGRRAEPRDTVIAYEDAQRVIEPCAALARELDQIERVEDAPQNPRACGDYGGCPYHVSAGGPCDARRSVGTLIQARVKPKRKDNQAMAISEDMKARFAALANKGAAATAEAPDAPAETTTTDIDKAD